MLWVIVFGFAFFWAWKARQATELLKNNANSPDAPKICAAIGLYYFQAMVIMGLFPYLMGRFTDNILLDIALWIPAGTLALAIREELRNNISKANTWVKYGFYSLILSIIVISFVVPESDYNFPEPPQVTQEEGKFKNPPAGYKSDGNLP